MTDAARENPVDPNVVDVDVLRGWMDDRGLGTGPLEHLTPLAGGTQNLLLRFVRDGRTYVLRRPPEHKRKNSDETMRREARVLGALAGSDVPHPALIAACPDEALLGAAFYLMEPVDGFNASQSLPELHEGDAGLTRLQLPQESLHESSSSTGSSKTTASSVQVGAAIGSNPVTHSCLKMTRTPR